MKAFISGLYYFVLSIIMWFPCHPLRRMVSKCVLKDFSMTSAIYRNVELRSPYRISIGAYTNINKSVLLDGRGGEIKIGNCVDIAQETNVWTLQHDYNSPDYRAVGKDVIIEDYVWIASRVTILPGVTIGRGAVVASCSVVTHDIPPFTVVAGIPAKEIGKRQEILTYKLGGIGKWFF